jgi:hypothetical protein
MSSSGSETLDKLAKSLGIEGGNKWEYIQHSMVVLVFNKL